MPTAESSRFSRLTSFLPSESVGDVLRLALWFGIFFGIAEASIAVGTTFVRHLPLSDLTAAEVFWTAPLAASTTLLVLASALVLMTARLPAAQRWRGLIAPALVLICTYLAIRFLRVGISQLASLVLAAGIATVVVRIRRTHATRSMNAVRRSLPFMVGALVIFALLLNPWRSNQEGRRLRALPQTDAQQPNVLVIIWDTARALSLSLYGYTRETTPELSKFASTGTTFTRAFSTAPWTLPSHASMFTGRYPFELSTGWENAFDGAHPTVAEAFSRQGYATGAFVANRFYLVPHWGLNRGFTTFDYTGDIDVATVFTSWSLSRELRRRILRWFDDHADMRRRYAGDVNGAFLSWLDRVGDRPFFGVLNLLDAHVPYLPPAPYNLAFASRQPRYWIDNEFRAYSPETISQLRDAYDGGLKYLDYELGQLLSQLRSRGVLDKTIVVITSDHGEELGAHAPDVVLHGTTLFATSTLVPLVIVYPPRIPANNRASANVSLRDIPATVMDLAGLRDNLGIPGVSLAPLAEGDSVRSWADQPVLSMTEKRANAETLPAWSAGQGELFSVVVGDFHYIRDAKGKEHLYNLARDIWEQVDLASTPEGTAALERFRGILDSAVVRPVGSLRARGR